MSATNRSDVRRKDDWYRTPKGHPTLIADCLAPSVDWSSARLIWTNPPFEHAFAIAQKGVETIRKNSGTLALLLRMAFLESADRNAWLKANKPDLYVLPSRPEFCASLKCTSETCDWHVMLDIDAPRPKRCPAFVRRRDHQGDEESVPCDSKIAVTTSDSAAYAWFVCGPGRGGRYELLEPKAHYLEQVKSDNAA
jgi:hypothetical protein